MNQTQVLVQGLGLPESTRWRDGCIWVCNWATGEVLAVTDDGACKTAARIDAHTIPFSIDWLPDGRMLVVDGPRRLLLAQGRDGKLDTLADLINFGGAPFNELVVDAAGNAYVNSGPGAASDRSQK